MIIAINTCSRVSGFAAAGKKMAEQLLVILADRFPRHQFLLLTEEPAATPPAQTNIRRLTVAAPSESTLLWPYWYQYKLPALLRRQKIGLLINIDGYCALRTRIPQVMLLPDPERLQYPAFYPKNQLRFFKKNITAFLSKATSMLVPTEADKAQLMKKYALPDEKLAISGHYIDPAFDSQTHSGQTATKEKYSGGKEYFLFAGELDARYEVINLLKAFSFFKKRQKSNMQLLLLAETVPAGFEAQFKNYKYRDEVKLLTGLPDEEKAALLAAAYIFVFPAPSMPGYETWPLAAMQCGVPVIAGPPGFYSSRWGDAAVYSDSTDFMDLAQKMMWLYKDEDQYKLQVKNGLQLAALHSNRLFCNRIADITGVLISSQTP